MRLMMPIKNMNVTMGGDFTHGDPRTAIERTKQIQ